MTDRELLELAAKAAGAEHSGFRCGENGREPLYGMPIEVDDGIAHQSWNPLEDDGDALRLRNSMQMTIIDEGDRVFAEVSRYPIGSDVREPYERDLPGGFSSQSSIDSAVRRAIVRAAAAIARTQEQQK